ncbi:MAG: SurA N-terminal domain-containing protein [bacterium JZ-2024 1]
MGKGNRKGPRTLRRVGTVERIRRYWRPAIVIVGGIFLITIPWVFGGGTSGQQTPTQTIAQKFVAEIDGKPFGNEVEVNRIFRDRLRMVTQFMPFTKQSPEQWVGLRIAAIDEVINNHILGIEARKAGIRISDKELLDAIEQEMNSLLGPPPAKEKEESKSVTLKDFFSALKVKQDPRKDQFLRYIANQYGSYEKYREHKRQQVLADRMRARITDRVKPQQESEARKLATEWLESLKAGGNFSELVKNLQSNPNVTATPEKGRNSLRTELPSELSDLAFKVALNEWQLAETASGVYVYQVLDRKEAAGPDYEREKSAIEAQIRQEREKAQGQNPLLTKTTPVDESEIKRRYERVTIRYIQHRVDVSPRVEEEIEKLRQAHQVIITDPYAVYRNALNAKKWDEALKALEGVPPVERDTARIAYLSAVVWEGKYMQIRTDPARAAEAKEALEKAIQLYETAMKVGEEEGTQNPYYYLMGGRMYWYQAAWDKVMAAFLKGAEFAGNDDMLLLNFERQIRGMPDVVPGKKEAQAKIAELRQKAKEAQQRFAEQINRRLRETSPITSGSTSRSSSEPSGERSTAPSGSATPDTGSEG